MASWRSSRKGRVTPVSLTERVLLALILAIGAGLRVWLLLGPFSEIDADPST